MQTFICSPAVIKHERVFHAEHERWVFFHEMKMKINMKGMVIYLKLQEILKTDDKVNVIDKQSKRKKCREREGKIISVNERFLTVNFGNYKESLDIFNINRGLIKVVKADCV